MVIIFKYIFKIWIKSFIVLLSLLDNFLCITLAKHYFPLGIFKALLICTIFFLMFLMCICTLVPFILFFSPHFFFRCNPFFLLPWPEWVSPRQYCFWFVLSREQTPNVLLNWGGFTWVWRGNRTLWPKSFIKSFSINYLLSAPLHCSCLKNPRDGGAWWAAVCGVAQSRTRLKRRSSSSSSPTMYCDFSHPWCF